MNNYRQQKKNSRSPKYEGRQRFEKVSVRIDFFLASEHLQVACHVDEHEANQYSARQGHHVLLAYGTGKHGGW